MRNVMDRKESVDAIGNAFSITGTVILSVFLIALAVLSVVELATRISAERFINKKLAEVNSELSSLVERRLPESFVAEQSNSGSAISQTASSIEGADATYQESRKLRLLKSELKQLRDQIATLSFSGATSVGQTIYALRSRLAGSEEVPRLEADIALLEEQARVYQAEARRQAALARMLSQKHQELEVRIGWKSDAGGGSGSKSVKPLSKTAYIDLVNAIIAVSETEGAPRIPARLRSMLESSLIGTAGFTFKGERPPENQIISFDERRLDFAIQNRLLSFDQLLGIFEEYIGTLDNWRDGASNKEKEAASLFESTTANIKRKREEIRNIRTDGDIWLDWVGPFKFVAYLPTNILLALSVVCCGGIGAGVSALRARFDRSGSEKGKHERPFRRVLLGLSAGFIAFLVIQGGKLLFVVDSTVASAALNPFGAAFAGILAGLFTEKAYEVLATLVDDLAERLKNGSG